MHESSDGTSDTALSDTTSTHDRSDISSSSTSYTASSHGSSDTTLSQDSSDTSSPHDSSDIISSSNTLDTTSSHGSSGITSSHSGTDIASSHSPADRLLAEDNEQTDKLLEDLNLRQDLYGLKHDVLMQKIIALKDGSRTGSRHRQQEPVDFSYNDSELFSESVKKLSKKASKKIRRENLQKYSEYFQEKKVKKGDKNKKQDCDKNRKHDYITIDDMYTLENNTVDELGSDFSNSDVEVEENAGMRKDPTNSWMATQHGLRSCRLGITGVMDFTYPSVETYVFCSQRNHLNETVLLSTHNICFGWDIRILFFGTHS